MSLKCDGLRDRWCSVCVCTGVRDRLRQRWGARDRETQRWRERWACLGAAVGVWWVSLDRVHRALLAVVWPRIRNP